MNSFDELFDSVKKYCIESGGVQETAYNLWIKPIEAREFNGKEAVLFVPSEFQKNVFTTNYEKLFKEAFKSILGFDDVNIKIKTQEDETPAPKVNFEEIEQRHQQLEKSFEGAEYDYTFDTFIVGRSNEFAYAACTAVAKDDNGSTYNPLLFMDLLV